MLDDVEITEKTRVKLDGMPLKMVRAREGLWDGNALMSSDW